MSSAVVPGRAHRRRPARRRPLHRVTSPAGAERAVRSGGVERRPAPHLRAPVPARAGRRAMQRRLERMDWSMSLFVLYFGTDRDYAGRVAHPRWCSGRATGPAPRHLRRRAQRLPDDFSLYLHAPTVTDPSLAPPGCGVVLRAVAGAAPRPRLARLGQDRPRLRRPHPGGARALLPDLRRHVVVRRHFTPRDFQSRAALLSRLGVLVRAAPGPERLLPAAQPRSAHPRAVPRRRRHPPGAGVPGVVNSAKATFWIIAEDFAADLATDLARDPTVARGRAPDAPRADGVPA